MDFFECMIAFFIASSVGGVIGGVTFINYHNNEIMLEMVRAGASPVESKCAVTTEADLICYKAVNLGANVEHE